MIKVRLLLPIIAGAMLAMVSSATAASYYASSVFADPGSLSGRADSNTGRDNPSNALGAPNGDFYSMGLGGMALFGFSPATTFDQDVLLIETTNGSCSVQPDGSCQQYPEAVEVYLINTPLVLSDDGGTHGPGGEATYDLSSLVLGSLIATVGNGDADAPGYSIDISGLAGPFYYVLLKDISASLGSISKDGFDVAAISVSVVPLPAALPLYGAGIAVMGFIGWRRKRKASATA